MGRYYVVGSLNLDRVLRVARLPRPGETVPAEGDEAYAGGKGGNQAVALARMGGAVTFVGAVGDDEAGRLLRHGLAAEGVDVAALATVGGRSGQAIVLVAADGESTIVVAAGANARLTPEAVRRALSALGPEDTVVAQLEVPVAAVAEAFRHARAVGARTVLDPAPPLPEAAALLPLTDLCLPNRHEAAALTGLPTATVEEAARAAVRLLAAGVRAAVVKLDRDGALYRSAERQTYRPALPVVAVDATAAGDAFLAAFLEGERRFGPEGGLAWGVRAGALAVSRPGARPSLPTRREVEAGG